MGELRSKRLRPGPSIASRSGPQRRSELWEALAANRALASFLAAAMAMDRPGPKLRALKPKTVQLHQLGSAPCLSILKNEKPRGHWICRLFGGAPCPHQCPIENGHPTHQFARLFGRGIISLRIKIISKAASNNRPCQTKTDPDVSGVGAQWPDMIRHALCKRAADGGSANPPPA